MQTVKIGRLAVVFLLAASAVPLLAESAPPDPVASPVMTDSALKAFAALHVAVTQVHDSIDAQLASPKNKTLQAQQTLREKMRTDVAAILARAGLTEAEYQRRRYVVSTDGDTRKKFDNMVAALTGTPTPGQVPVSTVVTIPVPAGPAGVHIGHVVNAFGDTPGGVGLLPMAFTEARVAAQHATLAMRAPTDLASMKLHAGHVLNALDPTIVPTGPGKGYGVLRATNGAATHIELAAKAEGASAAVVMHSNHIAAALRSAHARAEQVIALAKQVQMAGTAAEAAALVGQIVSLCDQVLAGADANNDGRVTWDAPEGGLQQAQEHVNLMLAPEKKGALR